MTDTEMAVLGEVCPRCGSLEFIYRKQKGMLNCHCDICGNRWDKWVGDTGECKFDTTLRHSNTVYNIKKEEKKDGLTVGAALGILSLSVFVAGVILSIGAMWMFGLGLFLTLCGFMNFE